MPIPKAKPTKNIETLGFKPKKKTIDPINIESRIITYIALKTILNMNMKLI
jgi:hypothetical protein